MSKYFHDKDYIYYPDTNIPINKLNIRNLELLETEERKLLFKGYEYFHNGLRESTLFDEKYFVELHRKTFFELYDFAGKYRNINISKGYTVFCQAKFLEQSSRDIFEKIKRENYLKDYSEKPEKEFAQKIAYYMCELIALHPFFEVNGRIIRLYFDMIATLNGYEYIDYKDALTLEGDENKFITASINCMSGNDGKLYYIILNGLKKAE